MAARNYQTYMGPTDPNLRHSEIEGYQPVSRIGEVVINSFSAQPATRTPLHVHVHLQNSHNCVCQLRS